jgi:hypothetical protein
LILDLPIGSGEGAYEIALLTDIDGRLSGITSALPLAHASSFRLKGDIAAASLKGAGNQYLPAQRQSRRSAGIARG